MLVMKRIEWCSMHRISVGHFLDETQIEQKWRICVQILFQNLDFRINIKELSDILPALSALSVPIQCESLWIEKVKNKLAIRTETNEEPILIRMLGRSSRSEVFCWELFSIVKITHKISSHKSFIPILLSRFTHVIKFFLLTSVKFVLFIKRNMLT